MRRMAAGVDPDSPARLMNLPAAWDDAAARALAALAPGDGPASLAGAAEAWIARVATRATRAGLDLPLADRLHEMLLHRQGAPAASVWQDRAAEDPRFVLNLPAFFDPSLGLDVADFGAAVETAVIAMAMAAPGTRRVVVGVADLAGLLAARGLDYGTEAARDAARAVAGSVRHHADAAGHVHGVLVLTSVSMPGETEALLGVETGGIAPSFSPLAEGGGLTRSARAWLAARGMTAEAALARSVAGRCVFPVAEVAAHRAMHDALAPFFDVMPARPEVAAPKAPHPAPGRRELPARRAGYTQKAAVGGHRVYLRTGEYADGTLGEVSVALPKDSATLRGLMDAFAASVSLGLQHNVPLAEFVEAFTLTRFGPAGPVEGDPAVARASSVLDYVFRHLAAGYLAGVDVPAPVEEPEPDAEAPLLPLGLPADPRARRRGFRVVG